MKIYCVSLTVFLGFLGLISALDSPIIQTKSGPIKGSLISVKGLAQDVYEFTGIPYAEAPIGNLRFKKPVPKTPWTTTLDATKVPNMCTQVPAENPDDYIKFLDDMNVAGVKESEDCLYLNIWAPRAVVDAVVNKKNPKKIATYIFIHGGSYVGGTAMANLYNGLVISGYDNIIFVSINYRLGSLGFAYFGQNADAPGNSGMWDQMEAMKWVSENIEFFGGDKSQVTIGGQSAGASSITLHLTSPYSRNYFQRAIVESGTAMATWGSTTAEKGLELTAKIVKEIAPSCGTTPTEQLACLREADASAIAKADGKYAPKPVIDGDFLPKDPREMLVEGDFYKVPLLIGVDRDEGASYFLQAPGGDMLVPNSKNPSANINDISYDVYANIMGALGYLVGPSMGLPIDAASQISKAGELQYWSSCKANGYPAGPDALRGIVQALGDFAMTCPTYKTAKIAAQYQKNVYAYQCTQTIQNSKLPAWMGAYHIMELIFAMGEPFAPYAKSYGYKREEQIFSQILMEYWGNFIKYGDPNARDAYAPKYIKLPNWPAYKTDACSNYIAELNYLATAPNYTNQCNFKARDCAFWDDFLPMFKQLKGVEST